MVAEQAEIPMIDRQNSMSIIHLTGDLETHTHCKMIILAGTKLCGLMQIDDRR